MSTINVELMEGENIYSAVESAKQIAEQLRVIIKFKLNNEVIEVSPISDTKEVVSEYLEKVKLARTLTVED